MTNQECTGYTVIITFHTKDAALAFDTPEHVRFRIGEALDKTRAKEEVDYTLDVKRNY